MLCARVRGRKWEGRHRKGCLEHRLHDSSKAENVHALRVLKKRRTIPVASDRVFKTLSVATPRDADYYLPHENEETSASIYILLSPYDNEPFITIMSMIMAVMKCGASGDECHYQKKRIERVFDE